LRTAAWRASGTAIATRVTIRETTPTLSVSPLFNRRMRVAAIGSTKDT
jgi:hypothetical protein